MRSLVVLVICLSSVLSQWTQPYVNSPQQTWFAGNNGEKLSSWSGGNANTNGNFSLRKLSWEITLVHRTEESHDKNFFSCKEDYSKFYEWTKCERKTKSEIWWSDKWYESCPFYWCIFHIQIVTFTNETFGKWWAVCLITSLSLSNTNFEWYIYFENLWLFYNEFLRIWFHRK